MEKNTPEVIRFKSKDAFAVYSLPGNTSHTIVFANDRDIKENYSGPAYFVQAFDTTLSGRVAIPADNVIHDCKFHCEVRERTSIQSTEKEYYLGVAREAIEALRSNIFTKVVLSKIKRISRYKGSIYDLFISLKERYPKAFVFLYHIPGRGYWCGASPEVLLRKTRRGYHTMALAGTQVNQGFPISEVKWGNKEVYEQHVIETFIEGRLEDAFIDYKKRGPRSVRAGNVLHICTDYYIDLRENMNMLTDKLHPSPAICGLPQELAREWITGHESHRREDYCGYTGPWDIDGQSALFVNLRSMSIWKNAFLLYLGGGLTAQSDARDEWEETELKSHTLLSAIEQTQTV